MTEYEPYNDIIGISKQTSTTNCEHYEGFKDNIEIQVDYYNNSNEITDCKLISLATTIYFAKTDPSAKIPTKRDEDAGYDIYACFKQDEMIIPPHTTVMIPTGIASACNSNYCFILKERGSTGSKGISQRCGVIDSGFRNAWFVPITNTTNQQIIISKKVTETTKDDRTIWYPYSKAICQALLAPVPQAIVREIPYEELQKIESKRGMGSLGSSNK